MDNLMTVVALGTFDGVHLGHKRLLERTNEIASEKGYVPFVFTFDDNPANSLTPYHPVKLITPKKEKIRRIKSIVPNVYSMDFSDCADMTANDFLLFLVAKFNARHFVCGFNFTFGKGREGNAETLKTLCKKYGFGCDVIDEVTDGETVISSTNIRRLLTMGRLQKANSLLTSPYSVTSRVVKGKKVGRKLGYPTLNQRVSDMSVRLPHGVYVTKTAVKDEEYLSVTDFGVCPTFGDRQERFETHILNKKAKIKPDYSGEITVTFYNKLRDERCFDTASALKEQIKTDISQARDYFREYKK